MNVLTSATIRRRLLALAGRTLSPRRLAQGQAQAQAQHQAPTRAIRRVLLLRPDHVGDVLLTAPAVALLRASLPTAHLTYLVGPWALDAARHGPPVDVLETLAYPGFTRRPKPNALAPYLLLGRAAQRLRRQAYDLAIVFRPDHWWGALLALAAGIPYRVGYALPETMPLLSHALPLPPGRHAVAQSIDLAQFALARVGRVSQPCAGPIPLFEVGAEARSAAAALWRASGFEGQRVVALHPSAGAPLKSWPAGRWAHLADCLHQLGPRVLLSGGPDDLALLQAIRAQMASPAPIRAGQALAVSAALFERCALAIGPDSGALHLAAAVGTPTLRLYGPAPLEVFGPWPGGPLQQTLLAGQLACVPCGHLERPPCGAAVEPACMLALGVDAVFEHARRMLSHG